MNYWLAFLFVCIPAQMPGRDAPHTYEFQLKKGEPQYGFIKSEDDTQYVVELDEPSLAPGTATAIKKDDLVMKAAETPQERETRIDALLNARNMVRAVLPDGRWLPVSKPEYALAQRARQMAIEVGAFQDAQDGTPQEKTWRLQPAENSESPALHPKRIIVAAALAMASIALAAVILRKIVLT